MRSAAGMRGNPPVLKKFGQHFLSDATILAAIVDALAPSKDDIVVEIGPGRGSLTRLLAERSGTVIAVEIDRALAENLSSNYAGQDSVQIVQGDFLETDLKSLAGPDFLLIGNVPYYITTPIVFKSLEEPMPKRSVFLVQREVAQRMAANANDDAYGALSVNVGAVARVEVVLNVPPTAFRPPPKVESSVVRLTPLKMPLVAKPLLSGFRAFVQGVFGHRRKQMQRTLRNVRGMSATDATHLLERAGIEPTARPENLDVRKFADLYALLHG